MSRPVDPPPEIAGEAMPGAVPETVPRSLLPVRETLESGLGTAYPGAVLAVSLRGTTVIRWAVGLRSVTPARRPALPDTVYDLASLTKVVATTPLLLQAAAAGALDLDDDVRAYVPQVRTPGITLRHLLAHSSGLPAWVPFYLEVTGSEAVVARAAAAAPASEPGAGTAYSDLGFMLLGEAARRALGAPLDVLARTRIFEPAGMRDTGYLPDPRLRERIAPTEDGAGIERAMTGEAGRRHPWRRYLIWGEVHDSNAHAMGGVSGHAGVFGTADDLIRYAEVWLRAGRLPGGETLLPEALVREATRPQSPDGARGLGWALSGPAGWWGGALSPGAVGHTGFTGTSMVVDPGRHLAIVLLTNAVHLGRDHTGLVALRPRIAEAVARALV
jgi:CubicO group peptidase (beta-lactamase class C family)